MAHVLSFRLDSNTNQKLMRLAKESYRSRAALLRLLIHLANLKSDLILPDAGILEDAMKTTDCQSLDGNDQEVQP